MLGLPNVSVEDPIVAASALKLCEQGLEFADALLARALARVTGGAPLEPLDDRIEERASLSSAALRR